MSVTFRQVGEALRPVQDPELGIALSELGLVYGARIEPGAEGDRVLLRMALTSPACPYGPMMLSAAQTALAAIPGVREAKVELVFDPPWDPHAMASEEAKDRLGIY